MNRHERRRLAALKRRRGRIHQRLQREFQKTQHVLGRFVERADDHDYIEEIEAENAVLRERDAEHLTQLVPLLDVARRLPTIDQLRIERARLVHQVQMFETQRVDLEELPTDLPSVIETIAIFYSVRVPRVRERTNRANVNAESAAK